MGLRQLVLGLTAALVVGSAGCAGTIKHYDKGCHMNGGLRMCTDDVDGREVTYFKGIENDKLTCGMRDLYKNKWFIIMDYLCNEIADIFQEYEGDIFTDHLWRENPRPDLGEENHAWTKKDKKRFEKEFDYKLKKAKKDVWKEP